MFLSAFREPGSNPMGIRIPAPGLVNRAYDIIQLGPWGVSRNFFFSNPACFYSERLRKFHILSHAITKKNISQHQISGLHETCLSTL